MKQPEAARLFGVEPNTIKNWTNRFEGFFSSAARLPQVRKRVYNEDDLVILASIAALGDQNFTYDEIETELKKGFRADAPTHVPGYDKRVVPAAAVEQLVDASSIRNELAKVTEERDRLLALVEEMRDELDNQRHEHKTELDTKLDAKDAHYQARIDDLQLEVRQLLERVGRAEAQVELLRDILKKDADS